MTQTCQLSNNHCLTYMQTSELEYNGLSGSFPDETSLTNLVQLNLAEQYLNGHICSRSDGTVVDTLFAGGDEANDENPGLSGHILGPHIGQLASLEDISIYGNCFSGSIASEIGSLTNLVVLSAGYNWFSGTIPQEITNLASLRELWLEATAISGEIPFKIGDMKSLEELGLYAISMEGKIPDSLYKLSNLNTLMLHDNIPGFEGSLKTDIGNLTKLSFLTINDNPLLTGTLPSELGLCEELGETLSSFQYLHLQNTAVHGIVPPEVCALRDKKLFSDDELDQFFQADCSPDNITLEPFFICDCCNTCCDHTTQVCLVKT
ncbi:hypothetical protein ACHAXR_013413 [Thalassiosira sp. AJA248-18]